MKTDSLLGKMYSEKEYQAIIKKDQRVQKKKDQLDQDKDFKESFK